MTWENSDGSENGDGTTCGGANGNDYPNDGDNAIIDSEVIVEVASGLRIGELTLKQGVSTRNGTNFTTLDFDGQNSLEVDGSIEIRDLARLRLRSTDFTTGGNLTVSGDISTANSSDSRFGTTGQILTLDGAAGTTQNFDGEFDNGTDSGGSIDSLVVQDSITVATNDNVEVVGLEANDGLTINPTGSGVQSDNDQFLLNVAGTVTNLLTVGSSGDLQLGAPLTASGGITNDGTIAAGSNAVDIDGALTNNASFTASGTVNLSGDFTNDGTFSATNGTVVFDGAAEQIIDGTSKPSFGGFTNSNTSTAGLTLNRSVDVAGDLQNDGPFDSGSTVNLSGGGAQTVSGGNQIEVNKLTVAGGRDNSPTVDVNTDVRITGSGSNAILNAGDGTLTFDAKGSTFTFAGGGNQILSDDGATLDFGAVTVESGATLDLDNNTVSILASSSTLSGDIDNNGAIQAGAADITAEGNLNTSDTFTGNSGGGDVIVAGDITNSGTFTPNQTTVVLNGSSAGQAVSGFGSTEPFWNLTVNNTSGSNVSLSDATTVQNVIRLDGGTFATGGNLTLPSKRIGTDGARDAAIVGNGGSLTSASGDRVQRFISESGDYTGGPNVGDASNGEIGDDAGYRLLSHPFDGAIDAGKLERLSNGSSFTFGDNTDSEDQKIIDDLPSGGGGSMIYRWDSGNQAYTAQDQSGSTDRNFDMKQGRGYLVFFFDDTEDPIDDSDSSLGFKYAADSTLTDFGTTPSVSLSGAGGSGFHLVGNPYPSGYDVGEITVNGTKLANLSDFANVVTGIIRVNDGNVVTQDFSSGEVVAPWQGFFIEQTGDVGGSVTVEFPSSGTTAGDTSFVKSQSLEAHPEFDVALQKRTNPDAGRPAFGTHDEMAFVYRDDATEGKDGFDSGKMTFPTVATARTGEDIGLEAGLLAIEQTLDGDTDFLSQDARPEPGQFPVTYDVTFDCANLKSSPTTYRLKLDDAANLPSDWIVEVADQETGETQIIYAGSSTTVQDQESPYTFEVSDTDCGSTVESKSAGDISSLRYDGSLTGTAKAATGSRFTVKLTNEDTLPVELNGIDGRAEGGDVILEWATAGETNNTGFRIQRKTDDGFESLDDAFVESAAEGGTTNQPQSYSYRLDDVEAGRQTFRLKQVNADGSASFSETVEVQVALAETKLTTYPNPVRDQATVEFGVTEATELTVALYNTLGQKVQTIYRGSVSGSTVKRREVDTANLGNGLYFVRMQGDGVKMSQRMTVVK